METRRAASHPRDRRQRWLPPVAALLLALSLSLGTLPPSFAVTSSVLADEAEPTATETIAASQDEPQVTTTETATVQPTATETAVPQQTATNTVAPEPTATGTAPPEPTATETPTAPTATATFIPEPMATATPTEGPVELEFVETDARADPGGDGRFELIVRNGAVPQTIDFATSSTNDWSIELFRLEADPEATEILLIDSDNDGRVDLGRIEAGIEQRLIISVAVPESTLAGTQDTLTVRVPGQPGERATLTVNPILMVDLNGSASFGRVDMLGTLDPSISGLTSVPDAEGATYVKSSAVRIEVSSNAPWTLACSLVGASTELTERGSGLSWRVSGTERWDQFARGEDGPGCASGPAGTTVIELDLRMRVDLGDTAETLRGTIHFSWDN